MKKAKILYIITQSQWGGAQRYVFDLATNLKDSFDVIVACGGSGELIERLESKGIKVFGLTDLVREISPWRDWRGFWEIYRLIKKERPDIVHTNSSKAEILGNLAAWLSGVKRIIFTAHGFVFNEELGFFKKKFYIFLEKLAGMFADKIICVSEFDRQAGLMNRIAKEEKFMTIHNGIDSDEEDIFPDNGDKIGTVIGTVANFYANKGLEFLVEAAVNLNKKFPELEFQVVGDGSERQKIEKLILDKQLKNFQLLGFKKDAHDLMKKFSIFVLPSLKEGFPYVILEAMAAGLPIVATRVGGVPEAVENGSNGFLVEAKDSETLAEKIAELITDKEKRMRFGQKSAERVRQEFSLRQMLEKTKKAYFD